MKLSQSDIEWIEACYKSIWPENEIRRIDGDGGLIDKSLQIAGVDLVVLDRLAGHDFYIDEKVRDKDYGDCLLEEYSKYDQGIKGWLENNNITDYLAYIIPEARKFYILPYPIVRRAYLTFFFWFWSSPKMLAAPSAKEFFHLRIWLG